jgi:hypothetical protein
MHRIRAKIVVVVALVIAPACAMSTAENEGTLPSASSSPVNVRTAEYVPIESGDRFALAFSQSYHADGVPLSAGDEVVEKLTRIAMDRATRCARALPQPPPRLQHLELLVQENGEIRVEHLRATDADGSEADQSGLHCTREAFKTLQLPIEQPTRIQVIYAWNLKELRATERREAK